MSQGEICRPGKRTRTSSAQDDETKANAIRPSLPNLVIHRIIQLLPAKAALRMSFLSKQWEDVWSLRPILEFDESANTDEDDDIVFDKLLHEHRKFVNILQRYLEFRKKHKMSGLYRFRLHMTRYLLKDSSIIDKWLRYAYQKRVKEVDLSLEIGWHKLPGHEIGWQTRILEYFYCITPAISFLHAKSISSLNLEFVRIKNNYSFEGVSHASVLPCLKNLSLKKVYLDCQALEAFILECPSIESLSLNSCCFEHMAINISSSSLKSLEVTHCNVRRHMEVDEAVSLENFTFLSEFPLKRVTLRKSFNLKCISICAWYLESLSLHGCHDSVEATIDTPGLLDFRFNGFLNSKVHLQASYVRTSIIIFEDDYNRKSCHQFQTLRDFLKAFDGADSVYLYLRDFKAIIFPEEFREAFMPPLPKLNQLVLLMSNPPTKPNDISGLTDSLTWMVPSKIFYLGKASDSVYMTSQLS